MKIELRFSVTERLLSGSLAGANAQDPKGASPTPTPTTDVLVECVGLPYTYGIISPDPSSSWTFSGLWAPGPGFRVLSPGGSTRAAMVYCGALNLVT